jgi:hypothetical protein
MDNSNSAFLAGIDRLTMKESSDGGESDSHVSFLVALTVRLNSRFFTLSKDDRARSF